MHGLEAVELVLGLLVAVAALATLARHIHVPYPILLVIGGLALSFVPGLPEVELEPELVFLLFLPPILYSAGVFASLRDFRANARPIGLLAIGLVLFTTVLVAVVAQALIPELPWAAAFALGAIVAPPDAVAATAIMSRLGVPRRIVTVLEGESLVNDATALVAYRMAVAAAVTGVFSIWEASLRFLLVGVGGIVLGLVVGWLTAWLRAHLDDPPVEISVSFLTPYAAYLPAEYLGVSGVLAAVTAGFVIGRRNPQIMSSGARLQGRATWEILLFILNGLIFILLGLQLRGVVSHLGEFSPGVLLGYALVISLAVILLRIVWVFPATYLPRLLLPSIRRRDPYPSWQAVVIVAWTGMRGIVSLAAALALPLTVASGAPFPQRDLLIFLTFSVILSTLVVQGLSLPLLIRWLGLADDGGEAREEQLARQQAPEAALARLEQLATEDWAPPEMVAKLRTLYDHRTRHLSARRDGEDGATTTWRTTSACAARCCWPSGRLSCNCATRARSTTR